MRSFISNKETSKDMSLSEDKQLSLLLQKVHLQLSRFSS